VAWLLPLLLTVVVRRLSLPPATQLFSASKRVASRKLRQVVLDRTRPSCDTFEVLGTLHRSPEDPGLMGQDTSVFGPTNHNSAMSRYLSYQ